jgi:hypothetical protein
MASSAPMQRVPAHWVELPVRVEEADDALRLLVRRLFAGRRGMVD